MLPLVYKTQVHTEDIDYSYSPGDSRHGISPRIQFVGGGLRGVGCLY